MTKPLIGVTSYTSEGPFGLQRSCIGQDYIDAIIAAGGTPIGLPIGLSCDSIEQIRALLDGLLLPGGCDISPDRYGQAPHPGLGEVDEARDALELPLAAWAIREERPVLGICRGIQILAVAGGGSLYQDLPSQVSDLVPHDVREYGRQHLAHLIFIERGSRLERAMGRDEIGVNSFHHQAVLEVPAEFTVTARSADGIVEAMEMTHHPFAIGVQCHPENTWRTTAEEFHGLFRAFVEAAAECAAQKASSPLAVGPG